VDPVNHYIFACFFWSKNGNILHQNIVYAASILTDLDYFWLSFDILFNVLPNAIYVLAIT